MPANTKNRTRTNGSTKPSGAPIVGMPSETVGRVLADRPEGATAKELAIATKLPTATVTKALGVLESAGAVAQVPARSKDNPRNAIVWRPAANTNNHDTSNDDRDTQPDATGADTDTGATTPDATDAPGADDVAAEIPDSGTDNATTPPATAATAGASSDASDATPVNTPTSGAPVSGPASTAGQFQVLAVSAVLGEHPDGITGPDLVEAVGMRGNVAGRVLAAMEVAGAARRLPPNDDGVELWVRGDGDPATVDVANAPTHTTCPTCGQRRRIAITTARARNTEPGFNSDGQPALRKGELRAMVLKYINDHRDEILTAGVIAKELGRSPGAVRNNLDYLLSQGLIQHADDGEGKEVMALPATTDDQ